MRKSIAAAAALSCIALSGCFFPSVRGNYEGGTRASNDKHVYVSRPHSPKTVSLVHTVTGETLWTVEIPVGQQLVVRFYKGRHDDPIMSDDMRWQLMKETVAGRRLDNSMAVPAKDYRRLDLEIRESPEYPPAADAG